SRGGFGSTTDRKMIFMDSFSFVTLGDPVAGVSGIQVAADVIAYTDNGQNFGSGNKRFANFLIAGSLNIGTNSFATTTKAIIAATSSTMVGLTVQGAASQTGNLQEWQDTSGTVMAALTP